MSAEIRYYREYSDDFVQSRNQDAGLPADFSWEQGNHRLLSSALYWPLALSAFIYSRLILRIRVVNRKALREAGDEGFFLYGNHTQPIGDAFAPACHVFPRRIAGIADPSNLGIPVLGNLLPMLGAIIVPARTKDMKAFIDAVRYCIEKKRAVVIYPEAHVWPYCTFIRPFPDTSFRFPIDMNVPAFSMTTTYQRRMIGKKPRITVYIDGPFRTELSGKEGRRKLHEDIAAAMTARSHASTYEYIRYVKEEEP